MESPEVYSDTQSHAARVFITRPKHFFCLYIYRHVTYNDNIIFTHHITNSIHILLCCCNISSSSFSLLTSAIINTGRSRILSRSGSLLGFHKFLRLGFSFLKYLHFLFRIVIPIHNQFDHLITANIPNYTFLIFDFLSTRRAGLIFLAPFVPTHPTTGMTARKIYRVNQKVHTNCTCYRIGQLTLHSRRFLLRRRVLLVAVGYCFFLRWRRRFRLRLFRTTR